MKAAYLCAMVLSTAVCAITGAVNAGSNLPPGFVYLRDVDGTILQDMRYSGTHNFIGRKIEGYDAAECILTDKAARALAIMQARLTAENLSIVVWDCYRPKRAVAAFKQWSLDTQDTKMKLEFYPNVDKAKLFSSGYIAERSAHSRGTTVDLGLVPRKLTALPKYNPELPLKPCVSPRGERFDDGTIDLGTGYDCLDPLAGSGGQGLGKSAIENRRLLRAHMARAGFAPYSKEWWHFELMDQPSPRRSYDFPVTPRSQTRGQPTY
jgi:D-alanyl-D-alanine dipeptidase